MSLENILLGILSTPRSGYQIKQDFDLVFSHFWSAELSQIYRTLKSLEKRGMLTSATEASDIGPNRRIYRRTPEGRSKLLEWLAEDAAIGGMRIPYLAKLFYLGELGDAQQTARLLAQVHEHSRRRLEALRGVEKTWKSEDPGYPDCDDFGDFHAQLVLDHGISRARAALTWAGRALKRLEARPEFEAQLHQEAKK